LRAAVFCGIYRLRYAAGFVELACGLADLGDLGNDSDLGK